MVPALHIQLLGGFRLAYGEAPVTAINTPRLQSLLAYLVLHRDAPQPRQHLAFLLWPDSAEAQARTNLRNLIHLLRHALPNADRYLRTDTQTLQWVPDSPFTLDVAEMERLIGLGETQKGLDLYRGDLLPGCYDDWILTERERLRALYAGVLAQEAERLEEARQYPAAVACAQRLLQCDPLHEQTYRQLMRLHALNEDRAAAIHAYHTCATVLSRELAVEPSAATRRAYEALLQVEPDATATLLAAAVPIVGRQQEWARMLAAWRAAAGGRPQMVLLTGEAGIGKTRLAEELLAWAGRQGIHAATARCYTVEGGAAYGPVMAWLRAQPLPPLDDLRLIEVARLLPEALAVRPGLKQPGPLDEAWQRQRLHEALARALLIGGQPLLLVLDDLQWCDRDTIEFIPYLLHFEPRARLMIVGALRREELPVGHPLERLLLSLSGDGSLEEIALNPLDEAETGLLAGQVAGRALQEEDAARLYRETEGNPLFIVETVRARATGEPTRSQSPTVPVPRRVQAAVEARLAQLSAPARELLGVAAVIGREFTFEVLRRVSRDDEEALVLALDELWQRRIVREQGEDGYDFSHHRLRETAYSALSAARRRLLHRRVAEVLEALAPERAEAIAYHSRQGQDWAKAVHYHRLAGEQARRVYACATARIHLDEAMDLAPLAGLTREARFDLLALREEVLDVLGERDAQSRDLAAMASLAGEAADALRLAKVYQRQARLLTETGRYDEAEAAARQALALADGTGSAGARATALVALGTAASLRGDPERAIPHLRKAVELCAHGMDRQQAAESHYALANALLGVKQYAPSRAAAEAALALYEVPDDQLGQAEVLNLLGIITMEQGVLHEATGYYHRALEICRAAGHRYGEARALGNWGNILYLQGRLGETLERYDEAAAIFRSIGHLRGEAIVRMNTAAIRYGVLGDAEAAQRDVELVLAYARSAGDRTSEGHSLSILGAVARLRGDLVEARSQLEAGAAVLKSAGEHWVELQARITLVRVGLDEGRPEVALADLEAAETLADEYGLGSQQMDLLTARAAVLLAMDEPEEASRVAVRAMQCLDAGTNQPYLAPFALHQALLALGRRQEAQAALGQAHQAVLDLVRDLTPEQQRLSLERQPDFHAICAAWRASQDAAEAGAEPRA